MSKQLSVDSDVDPESYLIKYLTDHCQGLSDFFEEVNSCQDLEITIGAYKYRKATVLRKIHELTKDQNQATSKNMSADVKDFNKVSLAASSVTASQNCSSKGLNDKQTIVLSGDKGAEDVVSMEIQDDFRTDGIRTENLGYDVLVSNAIVLPGGCRRLDSFGDQGKYEISWMVSSKFEGSGEANPVESVLPEMEVILKLECRKGFPNLITCRLFDAGDVIKDYIQEANQLAIHADFNVKICIFPMDIQFENFHLKEENNTFCFESAPSQLSDRFALDFLASSQQDIKVEVWILKRLETPEPAVDTVDIEDYGPYSQSQNQVFSIDLVRDMILKYVVRDSHLPRSERGSDVSAVCKAWRESVRRVTNSRNARFLYVDTISKQLKITPGGFPLQDVLPYNLVAIENHRVLPLVSKFLKRYPPIGLRYVSSGLFDENLFETVKSFHLQALEISRIADDIPVNHLQRILDAFPSLEELTLHCDIDHSDEMDPHHVILSGSLRNLYLRTNAASFQLLVCNAARVSNLKLFDVQINEIDTLEIGQLDIDVQEQIATNLNQFIAQMLTLEYLYIEIEGAEDARIVLPHFTKLKKLVFYGGELECHSDVDQLEHLCLNGIQTPGILDIFIQNRRFINVTKLELHLADDLTVNVVERMADCMPKCVVLDILLTINSSSTPVFRKIFTLMTQLTSLRMSLMVEDVTYVTPIHMDSYFTGLTLEEVQEIRGQPDIWTNVILLPGGITGIRDLCKLEIELQWLVDQVPVEITNLLFQLAFLRIPHLEELTLDGEFLIADELIQQWNSRGRRYIRHPQ